MTAPVAPMLTRRQRQILGFIRDHATRHGTCPNRAQTAAAVGLNDQGLVDELQRLQRAGWISVVAASRIRVLNPADGSDT